VATLSSDFDSSEIIFPYPVFDTRGFLKVSYFTDNFPFSWDDEENLWLKLLICVAYRKSVVMNQSVNTNGRCPYLFWQILEAEGGVFEH